MNTPIKEQETIIRFYRDENIAEVYTSDTTMMTKFDRLVLASPKWERTEINFYQDRSIASKTYECPREFISFRAKERTGRSLTPEKAKEMYEAALKKRDSSPLEAY